MGKVTTGATMSLDGFRISAASAELIKPEWENTGALLVGRYLYDMTNAWGGRHPMNVTTVVLTHRRPDDRPEDDGNFVFVTDGIEAAVAKAKELAGDKNVGVNGGQMARQCLEAGLLDEVGVELVPVVLGGGKTLFGELAGRQQASCMRSIVATIGGVPEAGDPAVRPRSPRSLYAGRAC